tara:strand:- start:523 stop:666 length:144 start_codon:yes stop_codon:yes gene_type:complete
MITGLGLMSIIKISLVNVVPLTVVDILLEKVQDGELKSKRLLWVIKN